MDRSTLRAATALLLLTLLLPGVAVAGTVTAGDLVINEILANPASVPDDDGEWFEVFNRTSSGIDINGWTLMDDDFDSVVIDNGALPLIVPAEGFLVLGGNADIGTNGGAPVAYAWGGTPTFNLGNTGDEILLVNPAGLVVDRAVYAFAPSGRSLGLSVCPNAAANDTSFGWTSASAPWPGSEGDRGTPGAFNDLQNPARCVPLPGAAVAGFALLATLGLARAARRRRA